MQIDNDISEIREGLSLLSSNPYNQPSQTQKVPYESKEAYHHQVITGESVRLLLKGVEIERRPDLQQLVLRQFGYDYSAPPPLTYPYDKYIAIAEFLRTNFFPYMSVDDGFTELGYRAIMTYFAGVSGQVLKIAARVMGPERGSQQFLRNIRATLPWCEHEMVAIRPRYMCYRKRGLSGAPSLMLGVLKASLEATGVKLTGLRQQIVSWEIEEILYEAEWE